MMAFVAFGVFSYISMKMNKEYFEITTPFCKYFVEIWHQYPTIDKVYVGGKRKCVSFTVYLTEDGRIDQEDFPQLDGFGFHQHCNITGNHIKGIGSIHLLNTAMRFVTSHYKLSDDTKFQFKDASFIECASYNMPLSVYYTIFYGKTWYELKFGATPLYISIGGLEEERKRLKNFLKTKPQDISMYFHEKQVTLKDKVTTIYKKSKSLQECLNTLKEEDCHVFKGWVQQIYNTFVQNLVGTDWVITNTWGKDTINYEKLLRKPNAMFTLTGGDGERMFFRRDEL